MIVETEQILYFSVVYFLLWKCNEWKVQRWEIFCEYFGDGENFNFILLRKSIEKLKKKMVFYDLMHCLAFRGELGESMFILLPVLVSSVNTMKLDDLYLV